MMPYIHSKKAKKVFKDLSPRKIISTERKWYVGWIVGIVNHGHERDDE